MASKIIARLSLAVFIATSRVGGKSPHARTEKSIDAKTEIVTRRLASNSLTKNRSGTQLAKAPPAARHMAGEYANASTRFHSLPTLHSFQQKFGPTGGQDAGFETFMPPAERKASKRQGGNGNDAAQYGGKYMTQSGQSSNGANNSSYAAQYGGKYAQQYLPSVFLMAQSGSSEQGSKKKVLDGVDYRAKYSEKYDKPAKSGKGAVNSTEKEGSYYQAKYGGSYASKYGKSSQVAKNSTAKQGSYYQTMYGGQYASQYGRTSQAAKSSKAGRTSQAAKSSKAENGNQLERGAMDANRSGKPSNLAESQGHTQHSNFVFLSVAALAMLILTSWVSVSAFFSRSRLAPPEEVATGYFLHV